MKVIIVGDAVVSTGFSRCTHALADELHRRGHDVGILGMNYWGNPHKYPYPVFPCFSPPDKCRSTMGTDRLPKLIHEFSPDAVVVINDPWNIAAYFDDLDATLEEGYPLPKMIGWLAVDGANHKLGALNRLDHIAVWTRFAEREMRSAGVTSDISIVPLGIDPSIFKPVPRAEARKVAFPGTENANELFVVGVVGRNQHRKRLDLTIEAFAEAWKLSSKPYNWRLYLHVAPTGEDGYDLPALASYHGVRHLIVTTSAPTGSGIDIGLLPYLYSSFDVYLSTSQGEGWGLPAHEAMACEVPCVLPYWGSFGDGGWVQRDEAHLIECSTQLATAPFNSKMYTIGAVPDTQRVAHKLAHLHMAGPDSVMIENAAAHARRLTSELTGQNMADVVESAVKK